MVSGLRTDDLGTMTVTGYIMPGQQYQIDAVGGDGEAEQVGADAGAAGAVAVPFDHHHFAASSIRPS